MALATSVRDLLLEQAWKYQEQQDYPALIELLGGMPESDLALEPELGFLLAQAQFFSGLWNESLRLLQHIEGPLTWRGYHRLARRRLNLEAIARLHLGDVKTAENQLLYALDLAIQEVDERQISYVRNNLGIIADIQCRWDEALANYQHAMVVNQKLGYEQSIAQVHQNLAMTYRNLGFYRSAEAHFEQALTRFVSSGTEAEIAGCEIERALLLGMLGDIQFAQATARRALRRFSKIGHRRGLGEVYRVMGTIANLCGHDEKAGDFLQLALSHARESGDRLAEAETLEELAVLQTRRSEADTASKSSSEAAAIYSALSATVRTERMQHRLAAVQAPAARKGL